MRPAHRHRALRFQAVILFEVVQHRNQAGISFPAGENPALISTLVQVNFSHRVATCQLMNQVDRTHATKTAMMFGAS